jgi:AcrR family transcriptional regulator
VAILDAAVQLVEEHGWGEVTVEAIAARAGTSKTTIYRWWPGKAAIVMDAFLAAAEPSTEMAPAGSLRIELAAQMKDLWRFFTESSAGRTITALVAEAQANPELATALRERWLAPRRAVAAAAYERARDRGELHPDVDDGVLTDALYGPLYFRLMFGHAPVDDAVIESLVDTVLRGATSPPRLGGEGAARPPVDEPPGGG